MGVGAPVIVWFRRDLRLADNPALAAAASAPAEPALPLILASRAKHQAETPELEQIQRVIVRLIEQRPATAAEIIRLWIEEDGNRK